MFFKGPLKKSVAILLCGVVLLSSWGYTIDQHFCQGKLVNTSFFSPAPSCSPMAKKMCEAHPPISKSPTDPSFHRPPCCQNSGYYSHLEINVKPVTQSADIFSDIQQVILPVQHDFLLLSQSVINRSPETHTADPPPLLRTSIHWTGSFRC